ncbi:uncharacterized protein PG986_013080 [Apiospora aurea]|uniref:Uncharacterized protein n=1 Tax=Apiospora aurea TaxID=335848 RepID=A0ABR1Q1U5_9PEZI
MDAPADKPVNDEKPRFSVDQLMESATPDLDMLDAHMTGLRISNDPEHRNVRADIKELARDDLVKILIGLCDADPLNTARVHGVLEAARAEGQKTREADAALRADGHQSSWQTLNRGRVTIEHIRKGGADVTAADVARPSHPTGVRLPPLRAGEAVCLNCRRRYFRKENHDEACVCHTGEPEHRPAAEAGGETPSESWTWPCCGQEELDVDTPEHPCTVGRHVPLVVRPGPPGFGFALSSDDDREHTDDDGSSWLTESEDLEEEGSATSSDDPTPVVRFQSD